MISYFINSIICAGFCWTCYVLLFQSEKMHQFNRYYLLVSLGVSVIVPLMTLDLPALMPSNQTPMQIPYLVSGQVAGTASPEPGSSFTVLLCLYVVVSFIFTIRLTKGLRQLYLQIKRARVFPVDDMKLVFTGLSSASYSFFNYLFIAPDDIKGGVPKDQRTDSGLPYGVDPVIWAHERAHARQLHSIDILLVEILKIACWFNPFLYLFKYSIQLNHEFLADEKVIRTGQHITQYQELLLSKLAIRKPQEIVSSSVFSITKKRFIMMTRKTSSRKAFWLKLSALPIMAICLFAFSDRSSGQDLKTGQLVGVNVQDTNGGISPSQLAYYQKQVEKMRDVKGNDTIYSIRKIGGPKEANKLINLYQKMSPAQKAKVNSIAPPPPPPPPAAPETANSAVKAPPPPPRVERINVEPRVEAAKTGTKEFPDPKVEEVRIESKKQIRFSAPKVVKDISLAKPVIAKKQIRFSPPKIVKDISFEESATTKKHVRFSPPKVVKDISFEEAVAPKNQLEKGNH